MPPLKKKAKGFLSKHPSFCRMIEAGIVLAEKPFKKNNLRLEEGTDQFQEFPETKNFSKHIAIVMSNCHFLPSSHNAHPPMVSPG